MWDFIPMKALLLLLALASTPAHAGLLGDDCKAEQILLGNWAFNRQFSMADGCLVQATPIDKHGLFYREYVFDQSGRFLVFDSNAGSFETSTGQQNFFLFPATSAPRLEKTAAGVTVTLANGSQVLFTADSPFIAGTSPDLEVQEVKEIRLAAGNLKILRAPGVLLDTGWTLGDRSYRNRDGASTFRKIRSGKEETCLMLNDSLFLYVDPVTREPYYQPIFRFLDPSSLSEFLTSSCGFSAAP